MARLNMRQRQQRRRSVVAEIERDATMLPATGPISDLIARIGRELDLCIIAGRETVDAAEFLRPLGLEAFDLVGSVRGLRAVAAKASNREPGPPEARARLIDSAWCGIGDERGTWKARGVDQNGPSR